MLTTLTSVEATASSLKHAHVIRPPIPWFTFLYQSVAGAVEGVVYMQVGALLFFFGCYFAVIETTNVTFEERWHDWHQNGQEGPKPILRLSPVGTEEGQSEFLSYYGCFIQFVGSIVFLVGALSSLLHAHNLLPEAGIFDEYIMVDVMFFIGGLCFAVGAYFLVAEGERIQRTPGAIFLFLFTHVTSTITPDVGSFVGQEAILCA